MGKKNGYNSFSWLFGTFLIRLGSAFSRFIVKAFEGRESVEIAKVSSRINDCYSDNNEDKKGELYL